MEPRDNKTAHPAAAYDGTVRKTIPYYDSLHEAAIDLVSANSQDPALWVDTGCGTGTLVARAYDLFPATRFILADPAAAMLAIAAAKLHQKDRATLLPPVEAKDLSIPEEADVITAIQSLHYQTLEGRIASVRNCHRLLKPGGLFITFENIRPLTSQGTRIGKDLWRQYQVKAGKSDEEARAHTERFDVEFFPLTVRQHLDLLEGCGFSAVELLWYSYMQAGFYGMK